MSTAVALLVAVALVVSSAFFVAAEFALVTARRHRLEDAAATSPAARAALRGTRDLQTMLAGSQLGITLCTLGLGAVAKPAVHDLLLPLFTAVGLPGTAADVVAFVLALVVVTFLHLVVGEMAPKSWAIAHPERSAMLLALPMRGFIVLTRPLLTAMNALANRCLRLFGVTPVDEVAAGHNPATLRELVDHSAEAGALDTERRNQLVTAIDLDTAVVRTLARPIAVVDGVRASDPVERVREVARDGGHLRLMVWGNSGDGRPLGMVHVRDTLAADPSTTAGDLLRPMITLPANAPVFAALSAMRTEQGQFALVTDGDQVLGLVTMQDLLDRLLPAR
jgi:CBS domain containing-hemolysin-like protein